MKSKLLIVASSLLLTLISAYVYFSGKEYTVRIPESQIVATMEQKLPLTKTYLFIIDVTLQNPRIELIEGSGKINGGMDVELNIKLNDNPKPLGGSLDLSGGVTYVSEGGQFFLIDPVIESLSVQGLADNITPKVSKALEKALNEYFSKNPIYTLKKADLKQAAAYAVLKEVAVEGKELVIYLGI
ncbi:hypothetical protein R50072_36970 [Simiduia litorea]